MDKILKIQSSQGSMSKNASCELAPDEILKIVKNEFIVDSVQIDSLNIEKTNNNIYAKTTGFNGIMLGGDHSVTYPALISLAKKYRKICLVMFDAHVDCASYIKPPSHEDFLRVLLEDKIIKPKDIFLIGIRKIYDVESRFLKRKKINMISSKNTSSFKKFMHYISKSNAVYLSIDIDVFDPKIAPGTYYKEKNGLGKKEACSIFKSIRSLKNLKIIDIVEVNPRLDKDSKTTRLAAEIADFFHGR